MKTAAEYRAMAEECFKWAGETRTDAIRESYLQLAQIWLDTASKLDGLPPTRASSATDKTTCVADPGPTTPNNLTGS
jgi:hypothetical protein